MIPARVDYVRAASLDGALAALEDDEAKALAGGQTLVSVMKLRLVRPTLLVDIGGLDLGGVVTDDAEARLGALTTWSDLAEAPELQRPALRALSECASGIGDLQVRNRGTLGGGLAHADPASDLPAVALALGATLHLRSASGERSVAAAEFFLGPFTTSLAPGELVTYVVVPIPSRGAGSAYVSVEHPASGFAVAGAAALVLPDGRRAVGVTGVSDRPFLLPEGADPSAALNAAPVFDDLFYPEVYRRHLGAVVVRRALALAEARAEEDLAWSA